jgi:hypothetical protein
VDFSVIDPEKSKEMLHNQKIRQKHSRKIGNRSFEDVAKFKCLGTTLTEQNCLHKEIKSRPNAGNACCHWIQSLFFFLPTCLLGT